MAGVDDSHAASDAPASLLHALAPWVLDQPDLEALIYQQHRLSYGAMAAYACGLADRLADLGVKPGDCVASLSPPRPEALIGLIACWLLGATQVGLNPRTRRDEQAQMLRDSGAKLLLSVTRDGQRDLSGDLDAHAQQLGVTVLRVGDGFWASADLPAPVNADQVKQRWQQAIDRFDPTVPAVIIYTSGSTGTPKGALIRHGGLAFRAWTMHHDRFQLPHVRKLLDLPVNHIGALASGVGVAWVAGGAMVVHEQFDPALTLAAVARERLQVIGGVPIMLARLASHPAFAHADLSSLRHVSWGAGPLPQQVLDAWLQACPQALFSQQYGMTESHGPIVLTPPTRDPDILLQTTGKPDPRLALRIADDQDQALPAGAEGEVQVRQPWPFLGYLNKPQASAEVWTADGFLRTGDRARLRADGYLVFCGRSKEMFKSGGFNVYPREVEIVLDAHPAVRASCVLGVDDPQWGQVGHAVVELKPGVSIAGDDLVQALEAWCRERLANYKVPKRFTRVDLMPRTSVDKVDRMGLMKVVG